jgi:transposase
MAPNMEQTARICFPAARRVTDRFHVQKLAYEAVQEMNRLQRVVFQMLVLSLMENHRLTELMGPM